MKHALTVIALSGLAVAGCGGSGGGSAPALNTPPTLSAIADQTVTANTEAASIDFTVNDDATAAAQLGVTAMSTNQDLVKDADLQIVGSDASRSLVITPAADEIGTVDIAVVATDAGGLSAASTFSLGVEPQRQLIGEFARDHFTADEEGDPVLINAIAFDEDAESDEFSDLLGN
jgi:hypothetical protein